MNVFTLLQIVVATLLIVTIILQQRGSTTGMTFGGNGESYRTKKGLERLLFYSTIVLAAIFAFISIIALITQ